MSRGITASDFIVSLGGWAVPGGTQDQQAGTFMHELGHNLALFHGGFENRNRKPNYLSVMSYACQMGGLIRGGTGVHGHRTRPGRRAVGNTGRGRGRRPGG